MALRRAQDIVVTRFKPSSLRLQQMLNVYGVVVSFIASLFLQEAEARDSSSSCTTRCVWA